MKLQTIGYQIALVGVAIILIWIGIFKFTPTEAAGIRPLVENSPMMFWMYGILSERAVSNVIGGIEIITGVLILMSFFSARAGLAGGVLSSLTFFVTLTFLFSTPGMFTKVDGVWLADGFILKDLIALGISLMLVARSTDQLRGRAATVAG